MSARTEEAQAELSLAPMSDTAEWDAFVRGLPQATFCHLSAWGGVLQQSTGHEPVFLAARDAGGELRGVLPMMHLRSRVFGSRLVSMPFLNYGGPVGSPDAVERLVERAVAEAQRRGVDRLELRCRERIGTDLETSVHKVAVLLELPDRPEDLWDSFRSKVRSQIRRPMKEGMEARFGPDQLEPFYRVFRRNMRDLGTPVLPRSLFEAIRVAFPEEAVFAAVYKDDIPVAGGAGFAFAGEFEVTWASALREYSRSAPNMLLYWSLMEEMIRRGVRVFNHGRCTPGGGTHRFKLQWGGDDLPLPWKLWPEAGDDEPGRISRLASAAWQRLPLAMTDRLGPHVARQLPWW